jgi:hypothetical protein
MQILTQDQTRPQTETTGPDTKPRVASFDVKIAEVTNLDFLNAGLTRSTWYLPAAHNRVPASDIRIHSTKTPPIRPNAAMATGHNTIGKVND